MELQHRAIIRTLGGLHSFPGESFDRALDAECGPGWWAIDFADAHPSCEVIGVDIVPIQPQEIPPNLTFECDDICQGLRFPDGHFDVIYSRNLCASITDWRVYLKELVRVLRPGGFLNCIENDLSYAETHSSQNTALAQWNAGLIKTYDKHNLNPRVASELSALLTECGLVDVQVQNFVIPGGSSPRSTTSEQETADLMTQVNMLNLNAMSNPFGIANDVHDEELSLFISEVRRDLLNPAISTLR